MAIYTSKALHTNYRLLTDYSDRYGMEYFRVLDLEGNQIDEGLTYLEAIALYGEDDQ